MAVKQSSSRKSHAATAPPTPSSQPLFFTTAAASFADAMKLIKVVSVVLPLRHVKDRATLHEVVVRKLLHKPYEPSPEELAEHEARRAEREATAAEKTTAPKRRTGRAVALAEPSSNSLLTAADVAASVEAPRAVYHIVHIVSIEVHADTARQVNHRGDVQVNTLVTFFAAKLQHGLCIGVAEHSPYTKCMQIRLPMTEAPEIITAEPEKSSDAVLSYVLGSTAATLEAAEAVKPKEEAIMSSGTAASLATDTASPHPSLQASSAMLTSSSASAASSLPVNQQLRITVWLPEEEPAAPGHALLVVSEPGSLYCMVTRPPRDAPGKFYLLDSTNSSEKPVEANDSSTAAKRRRGRATPAQAATPRRVVSVECAIPPGKDEASTKSRKRGREGVV